MIKEGKKHLKTREESYKLQCRVCMHGRASKYTVYPHQEVSINKENLAT